MTEHTFVYSIQPIDEHGCIGFEDRVDVLEATSGAAAEDIMEQLTTEGYDCFDITVTVATTEGS